MGGSFSVNVSHTVLRVHTRSSRRKTKMTFLVFHTDGGLFLLQKTIYQYNIVLSLLSPVRAASYLLRILRSSQITIPQQMVRRDTQSTR
jgi:hypothetical protein